MDTEKKSTACREREAIPYLVSQRVQLVTVPDFRVVLLHANSDDPQVAHDETACHAAHRGLDVDARAGEGLRAVEEEEAPLVVHGCHGGPLAAQGPGGGVGAAPHPALR